MIRPMPYKGAPCLFLVLVSHLADGFSVGAPRPKAALASTTRFSSSMDGADDPIDEELSKLIGKRSQIRRNKKREPEVFDDDLDDLSIDLPPPSSGGESFGGGGGVSPLNLAAATDMDLGTGTGIDEDIDLDMDISKLPDFQTRRPSRSGGDSSSKKKKGSDEDEVLRRGKGKKKGDDDLFGDSVGPDVIMDYTADYEDENELHIPNRIGVSTAAWGELNKGFTTKKLKKSQMRDGKFTPGDAQAAYNELLAAGVVLWETSPAYGAASASNGFSAEQMLAECIKNYGGSIQPMVTTAYLNKPWQRGAGPMIKSLGESCEKLGLPLVELLQVQNLGWLYPSGSIVDGMNEAVAEVGTANYVGVQGLSPLRLRRIVDKLDKKHGLIVATNSFEFSLTNRKKASWITACKTLGVTPLIRDPFNGGLASGKYTASNPGGGSSSPKFTFSQLEKLQPLHSVMDTVAQRVKTRVSKDNREVKDRSRGRYGDTPQINTDITTTQVALNYVVAKGGVPLAEVNNPIQAKELMGCLGWTLNEDEVKMLEAAADLCK